jgi:hypothetical protein
MALVPCATAPGSFDNRRPILFSPVATMLASLTDLADSIEDVPVSQWEADTVAFSAVRAAIIQAVIAP